MRAYHDLPEGLVFRIDHPGISFGVRKSEAAVAENVGTEHRAGRIVLGPEQHLRLVSLDHPLCEQEQLIPRFQSQRPVHQRKHILCSLGQGRTQRPRVYVEALHYRKPELRVLSSFIPRFAVVPHQVVIEYALDGICRRESRPCRGSVTSFQVLYHYVAVLDQGPETAVSELHGVDDLPGIGRQVLAEADVGVQIVGAALKTYDGLHIPDYEFVATALDVPEYGVHYGRELFVAARQHIALRLHVQEIVAGAEGQRDDGRSRDGCPSHMLEI